MKNNVLISIALALGITGLLIGCGGRPQPSAEIQPAQTSSESFKVSGEFEMHYNAVRTDQLTADIARAYGIERSKNKVMLNVSMLHKAPDSNATSPADADISVIAHNLNGQQKDIQLRRIAENAATYYIGEVSFSGAETLVFEIKATPTGSTTPIEATLTREFFAN
jgi:esterase/lipase superfamily enzyme